MSVYKDEKTNTWKVYYRYTDWQGKVHQTTKRGFQTKREALAWEREQLNKVETDLDMSFERFIDIYTADMKNRIKENTWHTKEHTIVVGFDIYLENVKRMKNSDLLVAITSIDAADANFAKINRIQLSDDPNAQKVNLSDDEIVKIYPYTYREICERCRAEIPNFKQGKKFNSIMLSLKGNNAFAYTRKLNPQKAKSTKTVLYSPKIIDEIKHQYEA